MKTITLVAFCLFSMAAMSQNNIVDVVIDDRPPKLNSTTEEYKLTGSKTSSLRAFKKTNTAATIENSDGTRIAKNTGMSVKKLKTINNLSSSFISVGQVLKLE